MQRWHLTLGLGGLAIGAALLAPRLFPAPPVSSERIALPTPEPSSTGSLVLDAGLDHAALLAGATQERFLTVRVTAPSQGGAPTRRSVDLGVVIDASGSMSAQGKIGYAKQAAKLLVEALEPGDGYALVAFADDAQVVVPATEDPDPGAIGRIIDRIYEGGGTNLFAGLQAGAGQVRAGLVPGDVGRVILLSDGQANVGVTDPGALGRAAAELVAQGITVSTVGLGLDYNEDLLADLADLGGGSYDFVDDPRELGAVFADELAQAASVVARGTWITIRLPSGVELLEILGWDAEPLQDGWRVFLGDVHPRETRKIVARVRIGATHAGERPVASVSADYLDLILGTQANGSIDVVADVTTDPAAVRASVDPAHAIEAQRAYGQQFVERSARAWADGDRAGSLELLGEGRRNLEDASRELGSADLANDARALDTLGYDVETHAPESPEARRLIKGSKERARVLSR